MAPPSVYCTGRVQLFTATPLRCRFDTVAQTRAHLHAAHGGTLLFFRGAGLPAPDAAVLVELAFRDSTQVRLLRGVNHQSMAGEGSWLRFAEGLVMAEVETGLLARRQHRRYGADVPVEVLAGTAGPFAGRLQDLSLVGARLSGESLGFKPGTRVSLRFPGQADVGPATVVWANRQGAGLYFDREDPACRAWVGSLYVRLQQAWQAAPEAVHRRECCQAGMILDPPLPK